MEEFVAVSDSAVVLSSFEKMRQGRQPASMSFLMTVIPSRSASHHNNINPPKLILRKIKQPFHLRQIRQIRLYKMVEIDIQLPRVFLQFRAELLAVDFVDVSHDYDAAAFGEGSRDAGAETGGSSGDAVWIEMSRRMTIPIDSDAFHRSLSSSRIAIEHHQVELNTLEQVENCHPEGSHRDFSGQVPLACARPRVSDWCHFPLYDEKQRERREIERETQDGHVQ